MRFESFAFFAISATVASFAGRLPDDFKVCEIGIAHYDGCLKDAIYSALAQLENGMPEISAPSLNPVEIPSAVVDKGEYAFSFKNLKLYNVTKMQIIDIKSSVTLEKFEVKLEIFYEDVTATCDYSLTGKLLLFGVDGGGKAVISLRNITVVTDWAGIAVHGKKFAHYQLSDVNFTIKTAMAAYQLDNLIKDNPELTKAVNEALNQSSDVLLDELKPVFQEIMSKHLMSYANNVFKYVSV
ncbi:hypothetical protein FQR65_LT14594 [Abscondita terminalis]|nr:hypothetical protein FQR65_LT14594 [Abscondita terminalis]